MASAAQKEGARLAKSLVLFALGLIVQAAIIGLTIQGKAANGVAVDLSFSLEGPPTAALDATNLLNATITNPSPDITVPAFFDASTSSPGVVVGRLPNLCEVIPDLNILIVSCSAEIGPGTFTIAIPWVGTQLGLVQWNGSVSGSEPDPDFNNNIAQLDVTIVSSPVLTVSPNIPGTVQEGSSYEGSVLVTSDQPLTTMDATLVLAANPPSSGSYTGAAPSGNATIESPNFIRYRFVFVQPTTDVTLLFTADAPQPGIHVHRIAASGDGAPPVSSDATVLVVAFSPGLTVSPNIPATVPEGSSYEGLVFLRSNQPLTTYDATLVLAANPPSSGSYIGADPTQNATIESPNRIRYRFVFILPTSDVTLVFTADAPQPGTHVHRIEASGDGASPVSADATAVVVAGPSFRFLDSHFLCYKVKESKGNICGDGAPNNEGVECITEVDCGGTNPTTSFCEKGTCSNSAPSNGGGLCTAEEDCGGTGTAFCVRNKFPRGIQVSLADQFEEKDFDIRRPVSFCNPADKNGEGINDRNTHLKGYGIKEVKNSCASDASQNANRVCATEADCGGVTGQTGFCEKTLKHEKQTNIKVENQFGTIFVDTIKPDKLLVPTAKSLTGQVDPLDPPHIDHFKCYKVKVKKKICQDDPNVQCKSDADCTDAGLVGPCNLGFPKGIPASVGDQFTGPAKLFDVSKPTKLCTPVDKNGEGFATPDRENGLHLMCYQVKAVKGVCAAGSLQNEGGACKKEENCGGTKDLTVFCERQPKHERVTKIFVNNQFGPEQLDTIKEEELCVPSVKVLPGD